MALGDNELFETNDLGDRSHRVEAHVIQPKTFGTAASNATLPPLTPVAFNSSTGKWAAWDANGSNDTDTMRGLVWPDEIVLDATDDTQGNVMLAGKVHYAALLAAVEERAVEVAADLATELKSGPRDKGIFVYGLVDVR